MRISGTGYSLDSQKPKAITSSTFHLSLKKWNWFYTVALTNLTYSVLDDAASGVPTGTVGNKKCPSIGRHPPGPGTFSGWPIRGVQNLKTVPTCRRTVNTINWHEDNSPAIALSFVHCYLGANCAFFTDE